MAVTPIRRIAEPRGPSLYDLIVSEALSSAWSRAEVARSESVHPELVIRRDGNLLVGLEGGRLAYSFRADSAFIDNFEPMFDQLLPRLRRAYPGAGRATFRLIHNPSRPTVEPVLRRLWFAPRRSWLMFSLQRGSPPPRVGVLPGVRFRDGSLADLDAVVRIDDECFPETPVGIPAMRTEIEAGSCLLIATVADRAVGFALFRQADEDGGRAYLSTLAVTEQSRGRGIGHALTVRVARKLFAEGARHLDLRTDDTNAPAVRLYVKLGFKQVQAGRDYARPLDPREIARLKKAGEGTLIRFGGWR
ncbi:MAG TPA: GNAT family N-acetyltransferase [Dehalococcoidia bacterium]|nr:GNAT family N-acetyltransferase [Dehalococcoidia bacterium]